VAETMSIGEVATRAGVRKSHIRYYEQIGVLPEALRVSGQRRYNESVLHRLSIVDVAQRAGLTLEEIRDLTGSAAPVAERIHQLADDKLPQVEALIERAQAVKRWLEIARNCDCSSVDVCGLFVDPTLAPPPSDFQLDVRRVA
jgi:MerR family transcriptional regulator, redox-sensitive transcriptional activator SoxR